jgi:hypothetical protein
VGVNRRFTFYHEISQVKVVNGENIVTINGGFLTDLGMSALTSSVVAPALLRP